MAAITTTEDIVANAAYHAGLLRSLSEIEYAPPAIKHHESYIKDLENQLVQSNKNIEELAKRTTKERKEHERLRDSTARRFAAKLSGKLEKFEANQMKEEREYVEALQKEMVERESNAMIQKLLAEAHAAREELNKKSTIYDSLRKEIDLLYSRIFDGPSESFPEEDKLEYDVHEAHKQHEITQTQLNVESQAAELLARAVVQMDKCYASVKDALDFSGIDMWSSGPGPSFADIYERDALSKATAQASQARALVDQARRVNPAVEPVGQVNIPSGSYMTDIYLDNIFSDMSFHGRIEKCVTQVFLANNRLKRERDAALERADIAGQNLLVRSQRLDDLRKELYHLRKAIFESVASHAPQPPSYDNVIASPPPPPPKGAPPAFNADDSLPKDTNKPSFPSPSLGTAGPSSLLGTLDPASHLQPPSQRDSPRPWGDRNPYAAFLTERTRSLSSDAP